MTAVKKLQRKLRRFACLLLRLAAAPTQVFAADEPYVGVWTRVPGHCDPDDNQVFRITKTGMEGREFSCTVERRSRQGDGWRVSMWCAGEGDTYRLTLDWRLLATGTLRELSGSDMTDYTRCPLSPLE